MKWRLCAVFAIVIAAVAGLGVMLLTGYVPSEGTHGVPASHIGHFNLLAGIVTGMLLAVLILVLTDWERGA